MCQGLPIALVQVKSGNTLKELLNEKMFQNVSKICQIIKKVMERVCDNIIKSL